MSPPIRIKICCMASLDEAEAAIAAGADAIGLVSAMPSGPGVIDEDAIASIAAAVAGRVETFLLTSRTDAGAIADQVRRCRPAVVQLVDSVTAGERARLRELCRGLKIVPVIHVRDETSLAEACAADLDAHALLLDSGDPAAKVRELGGTGRTHDWAISRRIRDLVDAPVYLAGGLNPENVSAAIRAVRPAGVDVCSGVRTDGLLDERKVAEFVAATRAAERLTG